MVLRLEVGMPSVNMLVRKLTEKIRDHLYKWSSEFWEARLLFGESGLGTNAAGTPLAKGAQMLNALFRCYHGAFSVFLAIEQWLFFFLRCPFLLFFKGTQHSLLCTSVQGIT